MFGETSLNIGISSSREVTRLANLRAILVEIVWCGCNVSFLSYSEIAHVALGELHSFTRISASPSFYNFEGCNIRHTDEILQPFIIISRISFA